MSSAPLIFVRDGRTLPYVPVTLAALHAIREHTPRGRPYAITTYVTLLEFANENRADRTAVTQRELVARVGASRSTVQAALVALQAASVLRVHERHHAGARLENEYVVVEPEDHGDGAESDTPARETGDPPARETGKGRPPGKQGLKEEEQEGREGARASSKKPLPDGFPQELRPHLVAVYRILKDFAERHNARAINHVSLAHAVMAHPNRHYVAEAHLYCSAWEDKNPRDCVAGYRRWLGNATEMAAPERLNEDGTPVAGLPPGVTPIRRGAPAGAQPRTHTGDMSRFERRTGQ